MDGAFPNLGQLPNTETVSLDDAALLCSFLCRRRVDCKSLHRFSLELENTDRLRNFVPIGIRLGLVSPNRACFQIAT